MSRKLVVCSTGEGKDFPIQLVTFLRLITVAKESIL